MIYYDSTPRFPRRLLLAGILLAAASRKPAHGAGLPSSGAGSILVPFGAGGITDRVARKLAEHLEESWKAKFVVENYPGAGGRIAASKLLQRPADGRTALLAHSGLFSSPPSLAPKSSDFDPQRDLIPVCLVAEVPLFLFAAKGFPADDLRQISRNASLRSKPVLFATPAVGGAAHMAGEVVLRHLGLHGEHVAYKDSSQMMLDVLEGRVALGINSWDSFQQFLPSGRIKILCALQDAAFPAAPGAPTAADLGLRNFDVKGWYALVVAKGTEPQAVLALGEAVRYAFEQRGFAEYLADNAVVPRFLTQEATRSYIGRQVRMYEGLYKELGL
jgi:tripartite-type tricarboxylate transporter receptor subunit TctC